MRHRPDRAALAVLVGLPVLAFVLPALAGFPVMPGDDLIQNYPLRVLAGAQIRQGHLPLLDPYIWSGAPLLGGWNAGAAYPLTLLFAVLPGVAAWTVNMTVTWWVAGLGTFAFLRASRLSTVASFLGALAFAFAGAMTAQLSHFGLVAGMSWVPVALLALLRLDQRRDGWARLAWLLVLAAATAMVVLAGEPRAVDDAAAVVASYAAWRAWRAGGWRERAGYAGLAVAGAALGVALGAVQWMPGIEAVHTSQRAAHSAVLFDSGSLPLKWLLLLVVPDLLGGSGSFGQPAFFGTYNLTEVTSYIGLMPLAAACALLGQLRRGQRLPEWIIWHLVALGGVVLALGGRTVVGRLLLHVPFFGAQRLQSRNMLVADFALAVLLAYWADAWLRAPAGERASARSRLLAAVPGVAAIGAVAAAVLARSEMMRWLGLDAVRARNAGPVLPWLVPFAVLGAVAIALVWWGPRLAPARRTRALVWFASADLVAFTLLAVVAVAPGVGKGSTQAGPRAPATAASPSRAAPVGAFTHGGRFAIYDPGLVDNAGLSALGVPDGNVISRVPSIEGYSAIVDGAYAAATGSHQATGEGQDVLALRAIGDGTLDQLDTTVLVTSPVYLLTPVGQAPTPTTPGGKQDMRLGSGAGALPAAPTAQGAGGRALVPHGTATWYFGTTLPVTSVTFPGSAAPGSAAPGSAAPGSAAPGSAGSGGAAPGHAAAGRAASEAGMAGLAVGLVRPSGAVDWITATPGRGAVLAASPAHPVPAVAVRVGAGSGRASLAPPVVSAAGGARYRANGALQGVLVPPRWTYTASDGGLAVFSDSMAKPPLTLRAVPGGSTAGAVVRALAGPGFAPTRAAVSSPQGVTVVRAAADIPGWTATWRPAGGGPGRPLTVRRSGLVQAVTAPPGRGVITWRYDAPGARAGEIVSLAALALLAAAAVAAAAPWRRRRAAWAQPPQAHPDDEPGLTSAASR